MAVSACMLMCHLHVCKECRNENEKDEETGNPKVFFNMRDRKALTAASVKPQLVSGG